MIQFINVSKTYENKVQALANINFSIDKGEFVFIMGASGAGKSTIAKLIFREEVPTEGQILVNNSDLSILKKREIPYYRRDIGFVFQDFRLLNNKNAYENVAFALRVTGASNKEIKSRVPQMLELVGLGNRGKNMPLQLSGGEQQRLSIARSLVNNPPIVLADEPTGNLDSDTSWEIMKLMEDINGRGATVIMVTHAQEIVDKMNKRVIALEEGKIISDNKQGERENVF